VGGGFDREGKKEVWSQGHLGTGAELGAFCGEFLVLEGKCDLSKKKAKKERRGGNTNGGYVNRDNYKRGCVQSSTNSTKPERRSAMLCEGKEEERCRRAGPKESEKSACRHLLYSKRP